MERHLPVSTKKTTFIASADGAVVPYTPPAAPLAPAAPLSREDRIDAYRAGLRSTAEALRDVGFQSLYECEHSYSMAYHGWLVDFRVQRPGQVAHITGKPIPGVKGTKGKHGGTIYKLSDEVKSEFAVMVNVGKSSSMPPIFIALDESLQDPAKHIRDSVLSLITSLRQKGMFVAGTGQAKPLPAPPQELPDWL